MDYSAISALLSSPQRIAITTHRSPDGDAIGSSLGLYHILKAQGHDIQIIVPDAFPAFLDWMEGTDLILNFEEDRTAATSALEDASVLFALDYNHLNRIAAVGEVFANCSAPKILIDHHIDPSDEFDYVLSDVSASSTSQLVYDFAAALQLEGEVSVATAECLYTGIMTDTGSFKFSSTTARTHEIVGKLMQRGLNATEVQHKVFDNNSFQRLKLLGFALSEKLEYQDQLKVAVITLSVEEKERFKYQKGDTEGLVNYGLSIKGSIAAVFLSEEVGFTKFSFRSKGELDVNVIARRYFNGGGHKNAAGGKLDMQLDEAKTYLYAKLNEELS